MGTEDDAMLAGARGERVRLAANGLIVLLTIALLAAESRGSDIVGLGAETPVIEFDVPRHVLCRDVTPEDYVAARPGDRLVQVQMPVSVVLLRGDVQRVREVIVEVDGAEAGLTVHDFAPDTRLESDLAGDVEVKRTTERQHGIDASLGGVLPLSGGTAHVTPSITAGKSERETATKTETRRPPKRAVLVSGGVNNRQGVYFKLRPSSQTTLEGEHEVSITFVAPADWEGGELQVQCVARGVQKWLFVKQRKVWSSSQAPVEVRLASHTVAKPVAQNPAACDCQEERTAAQAAGAPSAQEPPTLAEGEGPLGDG